MGQLDGRQVHCMIYMQLERRSCGRPGSHDSPIGQWHKPRYTLHGTLNLQHTQNAGSGEAFVVVRAQKLAPRIWYGADEVVVV